MSLKRHSSEVAFEVIVVAAVVIVIVAELLQAEQVIVWSEDRLDIDFIVLWVLVWELA